MIKQTALTFASLTLILAMTTIAYAEETTVYYDTVIKTSSLGGYEITVKAFERPSHEVLPIISTDYFPTSEQKYKTEVNNTKPSATYAAKSVSKVDIVFAIGDTKQSETLQSHITTFTNSLKSAGNYIDASVEQVKTSTIDMAAFGAREIFNSWRKMPVADGFGAKVWKLDEKEGKVYVEGNKKLSSGAHRSSMIIDDSEGGLVTGDFTMEFTHNTKGPAGEDSYTNIRNGWAPHISGAIFRYTENPDKTWDAYMLVIADTSTAYSGGTGKPYCAIIKVKGGDADMLPGSYAGTLPVGWSAGVVDTSGNLSDMRIDHQGLTYTQGIWCKGERNSKSDMLLIGARAIVNTGSHDFKLEVKGNNIKVYCGNILQLDLTDNYGTPNNKNTPAPYLKGTYGFYSFSSPNIYFSNVKITKGERKSLGDALSNVQWRDGSAHIIIHAADTIPDDMKDQASADYTYTLGKLLNTNAYLINLGTNANKAALESLGGKLLTPAGEKKDVFYDTYSPDIISSMDKSEDWIINLLSSMSKPVSWTLVNEKILWVTYYKDNEQDLPLNFGDNKEDKTLASSWGIELTDLYTEDPLFAEKWRYRHAPTYFDNSTILESYSDIWLSNPIDIFENPGKFRVNYKRLDNPFYPDSKIGNMFNSYRYWSTDYDRKQELN